MLTFRQLSEKTTKVKINPKVDDIKEGDDGVKNGNHGEDCDCMKCEKKRSKEGGEKEVATESKGYYDPMEDPDFDHDEAEATRGQSGKPAKKKKTTKKEEVAYVSQEEVSEEGNQSIGQEETSLLTFGQYNEGLKHAILKGTKGAVKGAAIGAGMGAAIAATGGAATAALPAAAAGGAAGGAARGGAVSGTIGAVRSDKQQDKEAKKVKKESFDQFDEGVKGAIKGAVKGAAKGAALGALGAAGVTAAGLTGGAAIPAAAAAGAITHGAYNATKGAAQNDKLHALRAADQKKRDAKLLAAASKSKTKKEETMMDFDDFVSALNEGRAEDAKKSLDAVKKRQSVLDAHEKKTGKKLDITKTPEHKAHKQNFPGAKRQAKKVRGAKETPAEAHNRKVNTYMDRLKKHGKTTKQKRDDAAMAKHTSRFD